ncbi:MAG: CoA-binding protein [Chloroflexota bacterium]
MPYIRSDEAIKALLGQARVIAVVGHSDDPARTSYRVAQYLRQVGYTVYPVNPTVDTIDGQPSYRSLADVPEPIDIVDVFRRSEHLSGIVEEAAAVGAKAVWSQLGVVDEDAAIKAVQAGLTMVMDRCTMADHRRLLR